MTVRDLLRRLAELQPTELPILSVYLDLRPQVTGENPAVRSGLIVLKDRLGDIEKTLGPRGMALESFRTDATRIARYVDAELPASAQGLAVFACSGLDLFEVVPAGVAFDNQVAVGPRPDLFQLARLLDEHETVVVALVDSNTARLFVTQVGVLDEVGGPDDKSVHYRKRSMGGWSQARYQRHVDKHRAEFAGEAAAEIERLVRREDAVRLVLAGDEVAVTSLRAALSPHMMELLEGGALRVHIRASRDEVHERVEELLASAEADEARGAADRLVDAVCADGLGTAGMHRTRLALEQGQADLLLLDPRAELDEPTRSELIRLATITGAEVEIVEGHEQLRRLGGVGALLRYRPGDRT